MKNNHSEHKLKLVKHNAKKSMRKTAFAKTGALQLQKSSKIVGFNSDALKLLEYSLDINLTDRVFLDICESIDSGSWHELLQALEENIVASFNGIFCNSRGKVIGLNCLAICEKGASIIDMYLYENSNNEFIDNIIAKLRIYEAFFHTDLLDINIKDKNLRYVSTSKLFDNTFDFSEGHAIGKLPEEIFAKKFSDHVSSHDATVKSQKQVVTQIDVVPFTGKHLMVQKFPLFDDESVFTGIGVFAVDVTALRVSEQRQIDAKNKYADYVELCTDILWETDSNWSITESNISEESSVAGMNFELGANLEKELKKYVTNLFGLEKFLKFLELDKVNTHIFEIKTGSRIKLGIKPVRSCYEHSKGKVIYRGILVNLN